MAECEGFRVDRKKLESEVGVLQSTLSGEEGKVTALKAKAILSFSIVSIPT